MRTLIFIIIILSSIFIESHSVFAVNDQVAQAVNMIVEEIAIIETSQSPISLAIMAPSAPGQPPRTAVDTGNYAYYTSTVASGLKRRIMAAWQSADQAPAGTHLELQAINVPTECGIAQSAITLSSSLQEVINNVESCHTGTGTNGANLKLSLVVDSATSLVANDSKNVSITFNITEDE